MSCYVFNISYLKGETTLTWRPREADIYYAAYAKEVQLLHCIYLIANEMITNELYFCNTLIQI